MSSIDTFGFYYQTILYLIPSHYVIIKIKNPLKLFSRQSVVPRIKKINKEFLVPGVIKIGWNVECYRTILIYLI